MSSSIMKDEFITFPKHQRSTSPWLCESLQSLISAHYSAPHYKQKDTLDCEDLLCCRAEDVWEAFYFFYKMELLFQHLYLKQCSLVLPMSDFRCLSLHRADKLSNCYCIYCLRPDGQGWKPQLLHVGKQTRGSNSNSSWLFEVNCGEWYMCSVWLYKADSSSLTENQILRDEPTGTICAITNRLEANPSPIFRVPVSCRHWSF